MARCDLCSSCACDAMEFSLAWNLSSRMLGSLGWFRADVSGLRVCPIFKGQAVQLDILTLEDVMQRRLVLHRRFGTTPVPSLRVPRCPPSSKLWSLKMLRSVGFGITCLSHLQGSRCPGYPYSWTSWPLKMLCSIRWFRTDVSGLRISPVFNSQDAFLDILFLQYRTDTQCRNVGAKKPTLHNISEYDSLRSLCAFFVDFPQILMSGLNFGFFAFITTTAFQARYKLWLIYLLCSPSIRRRMTDLFLCDILAYLMHRLGCDCFMYDCLLRFDRNIKFMCFCVTFRVSGAKSEFWLAYCCFSFLNSYLQPGVFLFCVWCHKNFVYF